MLFRTTISRKSNQKIVVLLYVTQARDISLVEWDKESIWLRCVNGELGIAKECAKIHCDSQSVIQ